ncbi:restriction endonuclease subunit S [Plantibacter sp. Mn2098]|uniref:restriction endonuclease subunit S n=1 Tax=Plantibacter sp. Mn2098 TaxID=3395266 RepID=UPI003BD3E649
MISVAQLVRDLCPDGVPLVPLGDVGVWYGGGTPSKETPEYWTNGTIPWVSPKDMGRRVLDSSIDTITDAAVVGSSTKLVPPTSVVMVVRSSILDHTFPTALVPIEVALNQDMKAVVPRSDIQVEYLAHVLSSRGQDILLKTSKSGGSATSINTPQLMSYRIPVPPLPVQREIVRILDQFTHLETELEAELEARRAQYGYYAGSLLAADADVPRVKLGDVAKIVRGASPRPIQQFFTDDPNGAPWIKIGDVPADGKYITGTAQRVTLAGAAKSRRVKPGDFVLSNSMSFGRPYISKIEGYIHDGWLAISGFEESFAPDYLYHLLRSAPIQEEFKRRAGAGTVQNLNAEIVRSVEVPLPTREVQQRAIGFLDQFDALVNDLRDGLPAEINARRKQYEHYRDLLLTFEERAA